MEKYREAREKLMERAKMYRKHGLSCQYIYDEIGNALSGVRIVAACDPEISVEMFEEIAAEIRNAVKVLLDEYRKEIGLEDEQ